MDDMNDLYNSQDVVLFFQIIKADLKSCTRDNSVVEVSEKVVTGGFSCVKMRFAFDTEKRLY